MKRALLTLVVVLTGCSALSAREAPLRLSSGDGPARLTYNFARCIAADARGGVHVVWYQPSGVVYRRSLDGGRTWGVEVPLGPGEHPSLAVAGKRVYVVWHDVAEGRPRVRMRRSLDGGSSWTPAIALSAGSGAHASVAVSGDVLVAVWAAAHQVHSEVSARRSPDGGATWEPERLLTDVPWDSWVPSIAASGDCFYLGWVDLRDGNEEEYLKRSTDRGRTWGPDQRLTRDEACSWAPSMVARGDELYFAWFDQQDAPVTRAEAERDLDAVMRMLRLPVEPYSTGVYQETRPHTAHQRAEAKHRQIEAALPAWARTGDVERLKAKMRELQALMDPPAPDEMKERKIDEIMALMGLTYDPDARVTVYFESAMYARIEEKVRRIQAAAPAWVAQGGDPARLEGMLKAFTRRMDTATRAWELYFRRSGDRGRSWTPSLRLTNAPGLSQRPSLGVDGNSVHVAWFDGRDGEVGVYYKSSGDGGRTWSEDTRLSLPGVEAQHASLAVGGGAVHVVWHQSTGEIRYLRLPAR